MLKSLALWLGLATQMGCNSPADTGRDPISLPTAAREVSGPAFPTPVKPGAGVQFTDVTSRSGIDFVHVSGDHQQRFIIESMGGGAAFFDYDADGYLDLYLVNGTRQNDPPPDATSRLYRNVGSAEGERRFADVTGSAGVGGSGWGMGCAVADYDNDGDVDLYVTRWGANRLYRNRGDGRFEPAAAAGVADIRWGTSAAFGDLDADGFLDLYVANYLEFDLAAPPNEGKPCTGFKGLEGFCGPMGLPGQADVLFRNRGDGNFDDVSRSTGIGRQELPALGVLFADYDEDGDQDIYVANDSEPNLLWRNDGDWALREVAAFAGVAYSEEGRSQAGMGVDTADYDNDGDLDIYVTNFSEDVNTLYRNDGKGTFVDATAAAAFGGSVRPLLGWSTGFFDADNDGWQDLFVANGHLYPQLEIHPSGLRYPQRNLLYWNHGGRYREAGSESGQGLAVAKVSRGAAFGDYDNDGDTDLIVVNLNDTPTLLRNDGGNTNAWLGLELEGVDGNRDGIGARVSVTTEGRTQVREVRRGYGYQSQHDGRLLFGLGEKRVDLVQIRWPSGRVQRLVDPDLRQYLKVREGDSEPLAAYGGIQDGSRRPGAGVGPTTQVLPSGASTDFAEPDSPTTAPPTSTIGIPRSAAVPGASAEENYLRGVDLHEQARYQEAVPLLREAVRMRQDYAEAYYALAVTLFSGLGEADEAEAVLTKAAAQDTSRAEIFHLLGAIRLSLDDPQGAIGNLERAARLAPGDWQVHNRLGVAHMRLEHTSAAVEAFQDAVSAAPYAPASHAHLARLYERLGRPEWARVARRQFERWRPVQDRLDRYQEALRELPEDAELHFLVGRAYLIQQRLGQAQAAFEKALHLRSGYALAHYGLGGAHHQRQRLSEAIAEYERAYALDSTLVTALNDLGRAYQQAGNSERAIEVLEKAVRRAPDLARAHLNLGLAYAQMERRSEAIRTLETAAALDSTLRQAQLALRRLQASEQHIDCHTDGEGSRAHD